VLTDRERDVWLLDAHDLSTIRSLAGKFRVVAIDQHRSTAAMLHEANACTVMKVGVDGVISSKTSPFPDARTVSTMAIASSGELIFSTTKKAGFYCRRAPNESPEYVAGSIGLIRHMQFDPSESLLMTEDHGTWRVWEFPAIRPVTHFCLYYASGEDGSMTRRIGKVTGRDVTQKDPGVRVPSVNLEYCVRRRLFFINDGWTKQLDVLFVSADSFSTLDRISAGSGLWVSMYLSLDRNTLVTGAGEHIRFWDISELRPDS
jgi:hypothetical protein